MTRLSRLDRHRPIRPSARQLVLAATVACLAMSPVRLAAADAPTLVVEASIISGTPAIESTSASIRSNEPFSFLLKYTCASSSPCDHALVTATLPPEVSFDALITPAQVASSSNVGSSEVPPSEPTNRRHVTPGTYTFTMVNPLPGGSTGQIQIRVRFPAPWTPNGTTATLALAMSASNATTATSNTVVATAAAAQNTFAVSYNQFGGALDDLTGFSAGYCFNQNSPNGVGDLGVTDATLTDTLPEGATFVSADQGGVESTPGVITWPLGDASTSNGCYNRELIVRFDSSDPANTLGATKTNTVEFTGSRYGESTVGALGTATSTVMVVAGAVDSYSSKGVSTPRYGAGPVSPEAIPGESVSWNSQFYNNGSLTLNDVVLRDDIPAATRLTYLSASNYGTDPLDVWIASKGHPTPRFMMTVGHNTGNSSSVYSGWPSGESALAASDEVTSVELRGNGLVPQRGIYLYLQATVSSTDRDGTIVNTDDVITNTVHNSATHGAAAVDQFPTASFVIRQTPVSPQPRYLFAYMFANDSLIEPSDQRRETYTLNMYAQSGDVADPTARVLLPAGTTLSSFALGQGPTPTVVSTSDWHSTGRTMVAVSWSSGTVLPAGTSFSVNLNTVLGSTLWGSGITASMMAWADNVATPFNCAYNRPDSFDLDSDGDSTEYLCGNDVSIEVQAVAAANIRTSFRGSLDPSFVPAPARAITAAGDTVTERVVVTNEGSAPLDNIMIVNVVPTPTDSNVANGSPRNVSSSGFALAGALTVPAGSTAWYTESPNPCRPEVGYSAPGCATPSWSTTLGDPANVTATKVTSGSQILDPGTSMTIELSYVVPGTAAPGSLVLDSAAFSSRRADLGSTVLPSESVPSGVRIPTQTFTISGLVTSDVDATPDGAIMYLFAPGADMVFGGGDDVLWTTTATSSGSYQFVGLDTGAYRVVVDPAWRGSTKVASSDADGVAPADGVADIVLSGSIAGADFSFGSLSTGDRVWLDADANGRQDVGEQGVDGVTVLLLDASSNVLKSTVTGDDPTTAPTETGWYEFGSVAQSVDFRIRIVVPSGRVVTPQDRGTDDFDSDADPNGTTGVFSFAPGNPFARTNLDMGLVDLATLSSVGDRVWDDLNADGRQDPGEPDLPGQYVQLQGSGSDGIFSTGDDSLVGQSTAANGSYNFTGVSPGEYRVIFSGGSSRYWSQPHQGGDATLDSDVDPNTSMSDPFNVALGEVRSDIDAASQRAGIVSGHLFDDVDNSSTNSAGDATIAYKYVRITGAGPDAVFGNADDSNSASWSDSFGAWSMPGRAGRYRVCVDAVMSNSVSGMSSLVPQGIGTATIDSDVDPLTGCSAGFDVAPGESVDVDAGYRLGAGSLSGHFWSDDNADGVEQMAENRRTASVLVRWSGPNGVIDDVDDVYVQYVATDSAGNWSLPHALDGNYRVVPWNAGQMRFSPQDQGSDDSIDSDFAPSGDPSVLVTVSGGAAVSNINGGLMDRVHIGDRVWEDQNANGIQDAGEPDISGTMVSLRGAGADGFFATGDDSLTSTGVWSGQYDFWDVAPGTYRLEVPWVPSDAGGRSFSLAPSLQGSDPSTDSEIDPATHLSLPFVVGASTVDITKDIGLIAGTGTISGSAWTDANANGLREPGEVGRPVSYLSLMNAGPDGFAETGDDITVAAAWGTKSWSFSSLVDGIYYINAHGADPGAVFTWSNVGNDDTVDSDVSAGGTSSPVTIVGGSTFDHVDVGVAELGQVTGTIWIDADGDGIRDDAEDPLPWIGVRLRSAGADAFFDTKDDQIFWGASDASGAYRIGSLPTGTYRLESDVFRNWGASYRLTALGAGSDPTRDSDVDPSTGVGTPFSVSFGSLISSSDVGYLSGNATVRGTIFDDTDGNGLRDAGEPGVSGMWVAAIEAGADGIDGTSDDRYINSTTTDVAGSYSFGGLLPGSYRVNMSLDKNRVWTVRDAGSDDSVDSDVDQSGQNAALLVGAGQTVICDGGQIPRPSVGDFVWFDSNGNGLQDPAEPGVRNVKVRLRWAGEDGVLGTDDDSFDNTQTDSAGHFEFGLAAGEVFQIQVDLAVSGDGRFYGLTAHGVGDPTLDSDVDPATGLSAARTASGAMVDLDIGVVSGTLSVGSHMWHDATPDGIRSPGEPGMNTDVVLMNAGLDGVYGWNDSLGSNDDAMIYTTVADGTYRFDQVPPGRYAVGVDFNDGYFPTTSNAGNDDSVDSDIVPGAGRTPAFDLTTSRLDLDGGFIPVSQVTGRAWNDENSDGIFETGEKGVGLDFELVDIGVDGLAGTDDDFRFGGGGTEADGVIHGGALAGRYYVQVRMPVTVNKNPVQLTLNDVGNDDSVDSDIDPTTGRSAVFDVATGASLADLGIGIHFGSGVIQGSVWSDDNGDGLRATDPPATDCNVELERLDASGWTRVVGTAPDSSGLYRFEQLLPGGYRVVIDSGRAMTTAGAGADPTQDSDIDPMSRHSDRIDLQVGELRQVDVGLVAGASVGDLVWNDADGNGVHDSGEQGLVGVVVAVTNRGADGVAGTDDDFSAVTRTKPGGSWFIGGLPVGVFTVGVGSVALDDAGHSYRPTIASAGSDPSADSNVDPTGSGALMVSAVGTTELDFDIGLIGGSGSIGDRVWRDLNGNGIQDLDEPILKELHLTLSTAGPDQRWDTTDDGSAKTENDIFGTYSFTDLVAGTYRLGLGADKEFQPTVQGGGSDPTLDSDVSPLTYRSNDILLSDAHVATDIDVGVVDIVWSRFNAWFDVDRDGVQASDALEPRINGLPVVIRTPGPDGLLDTADDEVNRPDKEDGMYREPAGPYRLTTAVPNGLFDFSPSNVGSDDTIDSDVDPRTGSLETSPKSMGIAALKYQRVLRTDLAAGVIAKLDPASGRPPTSTTPPTTPPTTITLTTPPTTITLTTTLPAPALPEIGDTVWLDLDGNGLQSAGEPGLSNVRVELRTGSGVSVATTVTDAQGLYRFAPTASGVFELMVVGGLPAGLAQTHDPDRILDGTSTVALGSMASSVMSIDFGYRGAGTICIRVDRNGSVRLADLGVELDGPNGIKLTGRTDAGGNVCFENLPFGDYAARNSNGVGAGGTAVSVRLSSSRPDAAAVLDVAQSAPSRLAFTGADAMRLLAVGAMLFAAGLMMTRILRRRRPRSR